MKIQGKPVQDINKKVVLTITSRDVSGGKVKKPDSCAAARACVRQLGALSARVYSSRTYIEFPKVWVRFRTPASLKTEIVSFDRGHRFEPGEYTLAPMQPAAKAKGKQQGSKKNQTSILSHEGKGKRRVYHISKGIRSHAAGWTQ